MRPKPKYRAPALEMGLEVVELLAASSGALTLADIADGLSRTPDQLLRLLQVLEARQFVAQNSQTRLYELTGKLLHLAGASRQGLGFPASIIKVMHDLRDRVLHSCHLSVASDGDAVVIERIESSGDLSFSVALGFRRRLADVAAGVVLFAFQPDPMRSSWLKNMKLNDALKSTLIKTADRARSHGFLAERNAFAPGIIDLCAPVIQRGSAIAAVTIPYLSTSKTTLSQNQVVLELCKATSTMSQRTSCD
jgi:DNA-binding IclR family transcriptional regulator